MKILPICHEFCIIFVLYRMVFQIVNIIYSENEIVFTEYNLPKFKLSWQIRNCLPSFKGN